MREQEFRDWLEANGANTQAGRNTRVYAVKTIETKLSELGLAFSDLEAAWDADRFESLRSVLSEIRADFDQGGTRFRILMPESEKPRNRLSSWRSWLGQYGRFLSGEGVADTDADRIRQYALENYIEPARADDEETAELTVKPINDALGMIDAWPNICQALRGRKFQELADVPPPQSFGADVSSATRFVFDLNREDYWALRVLNDRYGEPIMRSKKMASFEAPDGRQIALDLEAASTQIWLEGTELSHEPEGKCQQYVANAPRHSNLPSRLRHASAESREVTLLTVSNEETLKATLERYESAVPRINMVALDRLKARFLAAHPDFETGGAFAGRSSYQPEEDDYKRALISKAAEMVERFGEDVARLGNDLLDLLAGKQGLKSNLLGRWMPGGLSERREANPGMLEAAAGRMALADDPAGAVIKFLEETRSVGFPDADSRTLPTMLISLVHPDKTIAIWTRKFEHLFAALRGEAAFGPHPLTADEYARVLALANELFAIMRDEWGWKPRDLWDVQGFIWVTCGTKLMPGGQLDPTTIWLVTSLWGQEDGVNRFIESGEWSLPADGGFEGENNHRVREMQVGDRIFLKDFVPRATELPFDAGGGIVTAIRIRAAGTITQASEDGLRVGVEWEPLSEPRMWYFYTNAKPVWRLKDPSEKHPSADQLRRFLLDGAAQNYAWFLAHSYWHDRLFATPKEEASMPMKPTNLILYGPPGTGKTYRTAAEAVRLCDGAADYGDNEEGRSALMKRYAELVKKERIEFVTFHQNFSYEDFVEGLRPSQTDEDGNTISTGFRLAPEPGVFSRIAKRAEVLPVEGKQGIDLKGRRFFKMSLGEVANPEDDYLYDEALEGGYIHLGGDSGMDWSEPRFTDKDAMIAGFVDRHPDEPVPGKLSGPIEFPHQMRNTMREGDIVIISKGNLAFRAIGEVTGPFHQVSRDDDYTMRRSVRWLWRDDDGLSYDIINTKRFSQRTIYEIAPSQLKLDALASLLRGEKEVNSAKGEVEPYVLIIDEINRANISKVFGELITLIEPDKRLGQPNALKVRLPYSKREFGVPSNLHIIGTMNTADRSIALLDTALRRRFRFEEIEPEPELLPTELDGVRLRRVLEVMNERIEYLHDREHRIGHAFFMECKSRSDLDGVMRDKVLPLLQEYFFDDWSRIAAVAGKGFVVDRKLPVPPGFSDGEDRISWSIRRTFLPDAYEILLGKAVATDEETSKPEKPDDAGGELF